MKKTFADICLERAEKATPGPWDWPIFIKPLHQLGLTEEQAIIDSKFIAHARTDVPELARRLTRACAALRKAAFWADNDKYHDSLLLEVQELERMPENIPDEV